MNYIEYISIFRGIFLCVFNDFWREENVRFIDLLHLYGFHLLIQDRTSFSDWYNKQNDVGYIYQCAR